MNIRFDEAHRQIRTGDLLFFRGHSLWSWLIKLWTRSRVSHVGRAAWGEFCGERILFVVEAVEGVGVRLARVDDLLRHGEQIDWYRLRTRLPDRTLQPEVGVRYLLSLVGRSYASPWQFVRAFSVGGRLVGRWLDLPVDTDPERFFCSEAVAASLLRDGYEDSSLGDPASLNPGDLQELPCLQAEGRLVL